MCLDIDQFCRSSVYSLIKSPELSISERLTGIHRLDEEILRWWRQLPPGFKLTSSKIAAVPSNALPNILLLNVLYHQSLCALHASIVPLFCWGSGDDSWCSGRHYSAQVAFEQACAVSTLIDAVLSTYTRLSAMHTFVAYAAYSGCAIQIPFMWCSNSAVKDRANANVKANVKMIQTMAPYWKFAALLVLMSTFSRNIGLSLTTFSQANPRWLPVQYSQKAPNFPRR